MNRLGRCALALVLLGPGAAYAASASAAQSAAPPPVPVLDDLVVSGERERQRPLTRPRDLRNPDIVTVTRKGATRVRLQPSDPQSEIRFRRESAARLPLYGVLSPMQLQRDVVTTAGGQRITDVSLELAANIDEADGLPAVIPFSPHTSLVNIDYVRLRDSGNQTRIDVANVMDPRTRRCDEDFRIADDQYDHVNRFMLLADSFSYCASAARSREGDLLFADEVPENLRQALRELYVPLFNRFARLLGSEPGLVYVAWRPDSLRSDYRLEYGWSRSSLLLFDGPAWQQGLTLQQGDALREAFAREQVTRRLQSQKRPDDFDLSATSYLLLLAQADPKLLSTQLAAELPTWITSCARHLNARAATTPSPQLLFSDDCGRVLHFVYDAATRAESDGQDTIFRTLRRLLTVSYERGDAGINRGAFITSSGTAQRLMQGLLSGTMDWPQFLVELGALGVQLRTVADQPGLVVEVLSLAHFHD